MQCSNVLVVDDDVAMCEMVATALKIQSKASAIPDSDARAGYEVTTCHHAADALKHLESTTFDVVLTDIRMPGTDGLELCRQIGEIYPDLPVVVMTAFGSMELAIAALRQGAYDFITKPVELPVLRHTIARAAERSALKFQIRRLREKDRQTETIPGLIGQSEAMTRLTDQITRIADSDASVLITGESGTGKELVARAIHDLGPRRGQPFVAVNCGALSETLLESELFGHRKGAFTDARSDRDGLLVQASGGTVFLDEIGDMPLAMQVKLLRVLEERRVRPVGSDREVAIDVRILSATHRDLESAAEEELFREDLFYRINVIGLQMPPLRARGADVLRIAAHLVSQFAHQSGKGVEGITEPAAEKLLSYNWPGNVRELRNAIERAVALATHNKIVVDDLPAKIKNHQSSEVFLGGDDPSELVSLDEIVNRYIRHVLSVVDGNRTQAAQILGMDRKTLYRKLKSADENAAQ